MKALLTIVFSGIFCVLLSAQQTVTSTGGSATGTGGTVSFTVGQVAYTTGSGSSGSVTQGVQQPYEISIITSLEEAKEITLQWSAYPNPARDYLRLILSDPGNTVLKVEDLSYQLYDMFGKLLLNNKLEGEESNISMVNLISGTYILKVVQKKGREHERELKSFKIIKY